MIYENRFFIQFFFVLIVLFSSRGLAASPSVVVSIKPLQSLVAAVMDGIDTPALIVQGEGGSEHGYNLRPSDAENIANADIIFFVSPEMENFLVRPMKNLAFKAEVIDLAYAPGVRLFDMRTGDFLQNDSNDKEYNHKDLHFWLDPRNAEAAVRFIANVLGKRDPVNALRYSENARKYEQRLEDLIQEVSKDLRPFRSRHFIVFHDGYQYFEKRFHVFSYGSITNNPEESPSVTRISRIHEKVKELGSVCVFLEPQFEPRVIKSVIEGTQARTGVLDPLGGDILSGPDQYLSLIHKIANSLKRCLSY